MRVRTPLPSRERNMLSTQMTDLLRDACTGAFAQERSRNRAMELSLGTLCAFGRRTLSRSICAVGRQHQDWSADYKIFSRSSWEPDRLFAPVVNDYLLRYPDGPVCVAFDDTKLAKSGRKITSAFWQRDPLSPPFHVNFIFGLRRPSSSPTTETVRSLHVPTPSALWNARQ